MMKLDSKEYKEYLSLKKKLKEGKCTEADKARLAELDAKKNEKGSNDLSWWKNYPALLKDVTNFPFNWIPGTKVSYGAGDELHLGLVARAVLAPGYGKSVTDADAFNTQIRQLWLDLHRRYRGIGTYEKSDLGIAIAAIASLFETIAKFERIYGVLNTYHVGNRAVPYGLFEALRIDSDLSHQLADFRYILNLYIEKCRQLCLPKGLSVVLSDIVAMSNVFKDSNNRRAFMFLFDTEEYGVYDPTFINSGGSVMFNDFNVAGHLNGSTPAGYPAFVLQDIIDVLEEQANALLRDDDIARICSDLLAAYGEGNILTMANLPTDYKVEPIHDYERQLQFHNLTIMGQTSSIIGGIGNIVSITDVQTAQGNGMRHLLYQENNIMQYRLCKGTGQYAVYNSEAWTKFNSGNGYRPVTHDLLFDTWVDEPGEAEIMCGTRYASIAAEPYIIDSTFSRQEIDIFGTKVCELIEVWSSDGRSYSRDDIAGSYVSEGDFTSDIYAFCRLSQMDWYPTIFVVDSGDFELFGDIDNFTMINRTNLERLHDVALLSGYKCDIAPRE